MLIIPITVENAFSAITLNWTAPTTNVDGTPLTDLAGYKVYYGTSSGYYPNSIPLGKVTTYTFNNLASGTYYFVATAFNAAGVESVTSNEVSKTQMGSVIVGQSHAGVFRNGMWYMDMNQSGMWDSGDTAIPFGMAGDVPVIGDWTGTGTKKIGIFRNGMWYLDNPGTGTWVGCGSANDPTKDACIPWGVVGDMPVVGDWNGNGKSKIGVFRNGMWYLDYPGTGTWVGCGAPKDPTKDACIAFGTAGFIPVVGDWNGNGTSKIGVFGYGMWFLDYPGTYPTTGQWVGCGAPADPTKDACIAFGAAGDIPVVGDWSGDGKTKIGIFRNGTWYVDTNGNGIWDPGIDNVMTFGMAGDTPIIK
jgi:hypothetical protein